MNLATMPHRPAGWHLPGYKTKRRRIQELALEGRSAAEIAAIIDQERPGSRTFRSEVSTALAPLIRAGKLGPRSRDRAVEVEGVRYATITEAARAHGVSVEGARKRIMSGRPGWRLADPD